MSYVPRSFPVKVDPNKTYDFGTRSRDRDCELDEIGWRAGNVLVWWDPGSFDQQRSSGERHNAFDVMAPLGAKIVAPRAGRVFGVGEWLYQGERRDGAGWSDNGGWYVIIRADDGGRDYFAHMLERPVVQSGQRVRAGQVLGKVGQTGNAASTCPHLHYGVRDAQGGVVNPIPALEQLFAAGDWVDKKTSALVWVALAVAAVGLGVVIQRTGKFVQR